MESKILQFPRGFGIFCKGICLFKGRSTVGICFWGGLTEAKLIVAQPGPSEAQDCAKAKRAQLLLNFKLCYLSESPAGFLCFSLRPRCCWGTYHSHLVRQAPSPVSQD